MKWIELNNFVSIVKKALSQAFPGKHTSTKATQALQLAIESGKLLKGHAANCWQEAFTLHLQHLPLEACQSFGCVACWLLLNIFYQCFTWCSWQRRAWIVSFHVKHSWSKSAVLDKHAFSMIGYERKQTKYGEVLFLGFRKISSTSIGGLWSSQSSTSELVEVSMILDGADYFRDRTRVSILGWK